MKTSITVIIPTLNEADGIGPLVKKCKSFAQEVLVVDGGSEDGTAFEAEREGARVIIELERGYGFAYRRGFSEAKGEFLATADGDGTYPVEVIPEMVQNLLNENLQFISCSRFPLMNSQSMATTNFVGNKVLSLVGSVLWHKKFQDILSGMWVFKREALKEMNLYSKNWNLSQEIKIEAYTKFKDQFREYAIPYHERVGTPKLSPWKVGAENLVFFLIQRLHLRKALVKK